MSAAAPTAKRLPFNLEAEQALLGVLLYDNSAYERLTDSLQGRHFYEPFHQRLFSSIETHIRKGQLAEPILLADEFKAEVAFEELGGVRYLVDLVEHAPPAANVVDYARAVIDASLRRDLISFGDQTSHSAAAAGAGSAHELIESAEQALFGLAEDRGQQGGFSAFDVALDGFMETAAQAMNRGGTVTGLSTGLIDLDAKLGGLHPSDLIILAGRPSMGKTALATNIAFHAARNFMGEAQPDGTVKAVRGGRVAFYSLEMSKEQLAGRIVADVAGVSGDRIRKGQIEPDEYRRMRDAAAVLRKIPLHIDDGGGTSIAKITARARRLKRRQGLDLIVVDYLQLAKGTGRPENRVAEISEITGGLKAMAKDLGVPVIALSQLSRKVEDREDKRPQLADLRESGSIEQDADAVLFVFREAYYIGRAEPKAGTAEHMAWQDDMSRCEREADVIIAKQRHGPIGTVKLSFDGDTTRFGNLAREGSAGGYDRLPYRGYE